MPRFTLICDHSCDLDTHIVTHEFNAEHLYDVVDNIDMFLKGAGYVYKGNLEFVEHEAVGAGTNTEFGGAGNKHSQYYYDGDRNR